MAKKLNIGEMPRCIVPNISQADAPVTLEDGRQFPSNKISTTKYTVFSFLPVSFAL